MVPTVRVVITFTKFVELQPAEQFFTPMSSPGQLLRQQQEEEPKSKSQKPTWLRRNSSQSASATSKQQHQHSTPVAWQDPDPFAIPSGYTWTSIDDKSRKMKKSKSIRKSK